MLQPPSWQKDALPTGRGWAHPRTGELLKSTKLSTADINDYLGIPKKLHQLKKCKSMFLKC